MTNILSESQCIQYADDSTIYSELENELKLLEQWSKMQI